MKLRNFIFFLMVALTSVSCRENNYADYVREEDKAIDNYFKSINAVVVADKPAKAQNEWLDADGRKIFYRTPSGLYYHQVYLGDTTSTKPIVSSTAYVRYSAKDLNGGLVYSCEEKYSANPVGVFIQGSYISDIYGVGFQESVMNLYKGGVCESVVSFKIKNNYTSTIDSKVSKADLEYTPMLYNIRVVNVQ